MIDRYGPWALVVGASDGIGAAFATELAANGLNVVLVARREGPLTGLADELAARYGVRTRAIAADVSTRDGLAAVAGVSEHIGLLVVNAASAPAGPYLDLPPNELDAMLDLNCRAAAQLTRAYGPRMVAAGRGGVILLSSLASNQGSALIAHYAATKAYLRVLAEGLWYEWRAHGVDVLACCPGLVRTPTYERARYRPGRIVPEPATPESVARAALAALGRGPVVVPGWRNRAVDVFMRLVPRRALVTLASKQTIAMAPSPPIATAPEG